MLELKDFDKETRQSMLRNIEDTSVLIWKKTNFLRPIAKALVDEFGDTYTQEIWVLLTFAAKATRYETKGFHLSLDRNNYTAANKTFKHSLCNKRMSALIRDMEKAGYITFLKGFFHNEKNYARSAIIIKPALSNLIDKKLAKTQALSREDNLSLIEIVDSEKTTVTKKMVNGKIVKKKTVVLKTPKGRGFKGLKEKRADLLAYNKLVESSFITIDNEIDNSIVYKRRFEDDLFSCGRYFCGSYQTAKSVLRETITINTEKTCEVDYKNIQPRLLASQLGVKLPSDFDAYDIGIVDRSFAKSMLFPVLFSNSRKDAKTSITSKLKEAGITHLTSEEVVSAFEAHNHMIASTFFKKDQYKTLQNLDARMAEYVINHFTSLNIVALCYHDSFVVQAKYEKDLIKVMEAAWNEVVGNTDNFGYDVEFTHEVVEEEVAGIEHTQELPPVEAYESLFERGEYNTDTFALSVGLDLPESARGACLTTLKSPCDLERASGVPDDVDSINDKQMMIDFMNGDIELPHSV